MKTLVTMTPAAQRALALKWMKVGFDCSTKGINGVTPFEPETLYTRPNNVYGSTFVKGRCPL